MKKKYKCTFYPRNRVGIGFSFITTQLRGKFLTAAENAGVNFHLAVYGYRAGACAVERI